ncbi:MAG TPA: hypothetical protein VK791_01925 [bacterium]|jgi:hypothetical protein|nr:hypothetical protein [bacterium]
MKKTLKYWAFLFSVVGCSSNGSVAQDETMIPGSDREKRAIAIVDHLAVQHGYHPQKMNLEIKTNPETGDFMIFLFPKPVDALHLRRELGLFAIVNAKSGQVIRFSDPALGPEK